MNIINELDPTTFEAEIIFQTSRPVYNSNYETTIINFIDKNINFKYTGIEPILKTTNTFYDNLSSIISFYCYMTLAMDFDSFSMFGGDPYLEMAREVITSLPSNYAFDRAGPKTRETEETGFIFGEFNKPGVQTFQRRFL